MLNVEIGNGETGKVDIRAEGDIAEITTCVMVVVGKIKESLSEPLRTAYLNTLSVYIDELKDKSPASATNTGEAVKKDFYSDTFF